MRQALPAIFSQKKVLLIVILFLLSFLLLDGGVVVAQQEEESDLSGSWKSDLYLHPDPAGDEELINYNTTLNLSYSLTSFTVESLSRFSNNNGSTGLTRQSFEIDGTLNIFDVSSDVVFDPENTRLDYWLSETSLTFGGATITSIFLLEYYTWDLIPGIKIDTGEYGAGFGFSLSGDIPGGGSARITSLFGMVEDEYEVLGLQRGSGYDLTTTGPGETQPERRFSYGASDLQYVSTTAEFYDLDLGCCQFYNETKFSWQNGFEYSEFEFSIEPTNLPVSFNTTLRFSPQSKSVDLDPYIEINGDCFTTYFDLASNEANTYQLELDGFGLTGVKIGNVTFSSVTALKGSLYKNSDTNDIFLRASDYIITPAYDDEYDIIPYVATDYQEIASISTSPAKPSEYPNYDFGFDAYFNMGQEAQPFDLALVTANLTSHLSSKLDLGTGLSISPDGDIEVLLEFDIYF